MVAGQAAVEPEAPVGPDAAEESAFLAEQRLVNVAPAAAADEDAAASFPPMDDLIRRIPPGAREQMDRLFRARFITVKRIPQSAFKT